MFVGFSFVVQVRTESYRLFKVWHFIIITRDIISKSSFRNLSAAIKEHIHSFGDNVTPSKFRLTRFLFHFEYR